MRDNAIRLGPFDLDVVVGHGAMGVVWRGVHRGQQVPVAVKVVTSVVAQEAFYVERFRHEVEAMAGLNHPGIITVLDFGEVGAEASEASGGQLVAGSPYLTMEYASGGTLEDLEVPLRWKRARPILLAVLDALAHAHARGVVHRDLKPANVMVCTAADGRPGLRLTDFGLARAGQPRGGAALQDGMVGTPQFMAPEQVMGSWRDQGPWTDLYALGVMAYRMASGRPPFTARTFFTLAQAHLDQAPPPLQLPEDYPHAFAAWVQKLLAKRPRQRYRRAADAAWDLSRLEAAPGAAAYSSSPATTPLSRERLMELLVQDQVKHAANASGGFELGMSPTLAYIGEDDTKPAKAPKMGPDGRIIWNVEVSMDRGAAPVDFDDDLAFRPTHEGLPSIMKMVRADGSVEFVTTDEPEVHYDDRLPPLPETWRQPDTAGRSVRLVGAGLGLYGLHRVPLVDREDERTALWRMLMSVRERRRAELVIVRGGAGAGKTALADWLAFRAHEVGSATVLEARHAALDSPTEPLRRMVADALSCHGLEPWEVRDRVRELLRDQDPSIADYEPGALAEMIAPRPIRGPTLETTHVRILNPSARYAVVRRLLLRLGAERPVVLRLDDVQWGSDALSLVEHIMDDRRRAGCPVLIVVTVGEDDLAERAFEARQLDELAGREGVTTLRLGPLATADQARLIHRLLGLEPELARQVLARSEGNPMLAVQLIGDWVARGVLRTGVEGFELAPGEAADLPDDIHALWLRRADRAIDRFVPGHQRQARVALEVAAILGAHVSQEEWSAVCEATGVAIPPGLVDALVTTGVVARDPEQGTFTLSHATFRESLLRAARERLALPSLHLAAATALAARHPATDPVVAERIGRHLVAANRSAEAVGPLLVAVDGLVRTAAFESAHALLAARQSALDTLEAAPDDLLRIVGALMEIRAYLKQGWVVDAARCAIAMASVVRAEHGVLYTDYLGLLAAVALQRGEAGAAVGYVERALPLQQARADRQGLARSWHQLGAAARWRGELDTAHDALTQATELYTSVGDVTSVGTVLLETAEIWRRRGELQACESLARRAMDCFEEVGDRAGLANATSLMGEVARGTDDLAGAERRFFEALDLLRMIDSPDTGVQRVKLATVFLARQLYKQARWMLEAGLDELEAAGQQGIAGSVHVLLLPALAHEGDWALWDLHFNEATVSLAETGLLHPDLAWAATLAGRIALNRGHRKRAELALDLAYRQHLGIGDVAAADRILGELGP